MRVIKMYCDRCGKKFEEWSYKGKKSIGIAEFVDDDGSYLATQASYINYSAIPKELCESCYTELEEWWNSGRKRGGQ